MRSPVLFIVFNRPATTRTVFEAIRNARPARLYVAADGPRVGKTKDTELCGQVRCLATEVDWPCEVQTLFQERNLGCKIGATSAIDWFFSHESEGIILEDDIVPLPSFFPYCDELLERYRHDEDIGMICGSNLISKRHTPKESYFFSKIPNMWGWASWRRVWKRYDMAMKDWPRWRVEEQDYNLFTEYTWGAWQWRLWIKGHWHRAFDSLFKGMIDTWDYQWVFMVWKFKMLSILPKHNLIQNIGFGQGATHTVGEVPAYFIESVPENLVFPLLHPQDKRVDERMDMVIFRELYGLGIMYYVKRILKSTPYLGNVLRQLVRSSPA